MRHARSALILAALLFAAGCTPMVGWTAYGVSDKGPNDDEKALVQKQSARYRKRGNSTIVGTAYLITTDGGQVVGANEEIYLTPVTTFAEARVPAVLASNEIPKGDGRAAQVWWTGRTDASGQFSFEELADGEYFVLCAIPYSAGGETKAWIAAARVQVGPGEKVNAVVTRQLQP